MNGDATHLLWITWFLMALGLYLRRFCTNCSHRVGWMALAFYIMFNQSPWSHRAMLWIFGYFTLCCRRASLNWQHGQPCVLEISFFSSWVVLSQHPKFIGFVYLFLHIGILLSVNFFRFDSGCIHDSSLTFDPVACSVSRVGHQLEAIDICT